MLISNGATYLDEKTVVVFNDNNVDIKGPQML